MTTQTAGPLTREHLKALRQAQRLSFNHSPERSYINAIRDTRAAKDVDHEIDVVSVVRATGNSNLLLGTKPLKDCAYGHAFIYGDCGDSGREWRTIVTFLKPGDELKLIWSGDYETNGYMEKAQLHGDRLTLEIRRKEKRYCFIVIVSVCEHNTARLIRRGVFNNE